jgi:hypothetical protein
MSKRQARMAGSPDFAMLLYILEFVPFAFLIQ